MLWIAGMTLETKVMVKLSYYTVLNVIVRGDRDSRANLMPIYGDLYQIKL